MPQATYQLVTPTPAGDAAIAAIEIHGDVDAALAALGIDAVEPGTAPLRSLAGIDRGIVARWSRARATLMPHAGPAVVASLLAACGDAGLVPVARGAAVGSFQDRLDRALSRTASPLAIDLLLDQERRWAAHREGSPLAPAESLNRLVYPALVVVVGPPNIGKSSLLNAMAGRDLSLVADQPGTTRDGVGVSLIVAGLAIRWVDTPGLSSVPASELDRAAQEAARILVSRADLLLVAQSTGHPVMTPTPRKGQPLLRVALRADLGSVAGPVDVHTSARSGAGLLDLSELIRRTLVPDQALAHPGPWAFWPRGANNADVPTASLNLRDSQRLTHAREYQRAYAARTSVTRGPLRVHAVPNTTGRTRLGLSVPKRGGTSVQRNLVKRLIREAFRLCQHDLPAGHDLVVSVQPHEALPLEHYQRALQAAATELAATWAARARKGRRS